MINRIIFAQIVSILLCFSCVNNTEGPDGKEFELSIERKISSFCIKLSNTSSSDKTLSHYKIFDGEFSFHKGNEVKVAFKKDYTNNLLKGISGWETIDIPANQTKTFIVPFSEINLPYDNWDEVVCRMSIRLNNEYVDLTSNKLKNK